MKNKTCRTITSCKYCPMQPNIIVKKQSYICKYKGEWDKYHKGGKYSLGKCTHPIIGGKECFEYKFDEKYCDYDLCYECDCDDLGWCAYRKSQAISIKIESNKIKIYKSEENKMAKEIIIDGIKYVPENQKAETLNGMTYCIIRTYSAGVFAGYVEKRDGKEAVIRNARCLWYWVGAASLLQLAQTGVTKPDECKFTVTVDKIELTEVIEIIPCTKESQESILGVKEWKIK